MPRRRRPASRPRRPRSATSRLRRYVRIWREREHGAEQGRRETLGGTVRGVAGRSLAPGGRADQRIPTWATEVIAGKGLRPAVACLRSPAGACSCVGPWLTQEAGCMLAALGTADIIICLARPFYSGARGCGTAPIGRTSTARLYGSWRASWRRPRKSGGGSWPQRRLSSRR